MMVVIAEVCNGCIKWKQKQSNNHSFPF